MARSRPLSGIVALLLAFGLLAGFPITAAAADEVAFTINDDRITESSGLATDPTGRRLLDGQRLRGPPASRTG